VIAVAAAGTLTLAAAITAAAAMHSPGTVAAPASAASAYLTVINGQQGARRAAPAVAAIAATQLLGKVSLGARQHGHELAIARAAARARAAAKAAAAKAAAARRAAAPKAAAAQAAAAQAAAVPAAAPSPTPSAAPVAVQAAPVTSGTAQQIAEQMLGQYGWSASQFSCLDPLWARESGWNVYAENPGSGAYGIPQAMPGSEMASAGPDWQTSAATQIRWGLSYIQSRYGSPCGAWAHEESTGWY
jgi:hypothetical protein